MFKNSTKSKYLLANLRNGTLLCTVLILLSCSQLSNSGPREKSQRYDSSVLQKRLASGDYVAVILVDGNQKTSVFAAGGQDITNRPCGKVEEDGSIVVNRELRKEEQCNLKGIDLLSINNVGMYKIKYNPRCMAIMIGGRIYSLHEGSDGFPRGAYPCHGGGH